MGIEENIFREQLNRGIFDNAKVDFAKGLAQLAVDKGYGSLSPKQKTILQPYLSMQCVGFTDPGDHHNKCQAILEGNDLLEAYQLSYGSELLMCDSCRNEQNYYKYQWEKMSKE